MAPVGMVGMFGDWQSLVYSSSPEAGLLSLFILLILSITLLTLCLRCRRNKGKAYDVNGSQPDGQVGVKGGASTAKKGGAGETNLAFTTWRDHKNMPDSTLERSTVSAP